MIDEDTTHYVINRRYFDYSAVLKISRHYYSISRTVRLTFPITGQFPSGHLDYNEAISAYAKRETLEKTGLVVKVTRLVAVTNSVFSDVGKHFITRCPYAD
ncbi:nudix domain-containing protein [Colletotrichum graminicola]|nr:nudix domain-containing protein [Colletotrichum graminicola]